VQIKEAQPVSILAQGSMNQQAVHPATSLFQNQAVNYRFAAKLRTACNAFRLRCPSAIMSFAS
jgi:hypothetical protein